MSLKTYSLTVLAIGGLAGCAGDVAPGSSESSAAAISSTTVVSSSSAAVSSNAPVISSAAPVSSSSAASSVSEVLTCAEDQAIGAQLYKDKNCSLCHGDVPSDGTTIWRGDLAGINLFDSSGDGYMAGGGVLHKLPLDEFIHKYMPPSGGLSKIEAQQITAYMTNAVNAGQPWCRSQDASSSSAPAAVSCDARPSRIWRLTPKQLENTVKSILPNSDLSFGALINTLTAAKGFSNDADSRVASTPHVKELVELAEAFTEQVVSQRNAFSACLNGGDFDKACVSSFLSDFLTIAFRRPSDQTLVNHYADFFAQERATGTSLDAFKQTVRMVFLSPRFVFRTEMGPSEPGVATMDQYDRASALSYILSDSPPDDDLLRAAEAGALSTSTQLTAHIQRLLSSPDTAPGIVQFLSEFFGTEQVTQSDIDDVAYPDWNAELAQEFLGSARAFYEEVIFNDDGHLNTLFTSDYAMVNNTVAPFYGLQPTGSNEYVKRTMPNGQRSGIFTQSAYLVPVSGFSEPDITIRGNHIRSHIMCDTLPAPAEIPPLPVAENLSRRERLETIHQANDLCWSCHKFMDPLGYPFEFYDNLGRWRGATETLANGVVKPLRSSGNILRKESGELIDVADAIELTHALVDLPEVKSCFVENMAGYLAGGKNEEIDGCRVDQAASSFSGDINELVIRLLADESYYLRETLDPSKGASPTIEAEDYNSGSPVEPFALQQDGGRSIMVWPTTNGNNANVADGTAGQLHYTMTATMSSATLFATVNFANADDDSFYYKLEGASDWAVFNNTSTAGYEELEIITWTGLTVGQTYTVKIQRREDGAKFDSFRIEGGNFSK